MRFLLLALVAARSIEVVSCQAQTAINPTPSDGDTKVVLTFSALGSSEDGKLYTATAPVAAGVAATCNPTTDHAVALQAGVPTTAAAGATTLTLITSSPLKQGTQICAAMGAVLSQVKTVEAAAAPPGYDWGLVRAYFTAGALLSQQNGQFSHQDLFLAFQLDKSYWVHSTTILGTTTYRPLLHSYFDTRLTALPVAVQNCSPSSSGTPNTAPATNCSSSNSGSSSGSSSSDATTQAFLNSQKSARLEFGAFVPAYITRWSVTSQSGSIKIPTYYGLFLAPLVEVGFDTALNGLNQTQQQSATSAQVQPVGNSSQFYKFYDYGFRLGHDQLSTDSGEAPSEVSYLNVGWGRFSNMASLLCPRNEYAGNNTCNATAGSLPWSRDYRLRLEGLLEVPATKGFSVGFSTNVSQHIKVTASTVHIEPADDLRFLFGWKFDIGSIASKLAPSL